MLAAGAPRWPFWSRAAATTSGSWCRRAELADEIDRTRENHTYLPGVSIPPGVHPTASLEEALTGASAVLLVPISRAARETASRVAPYLAPGIPVAHATKGLEFPSLRRLSEVVADEVGRDASQVAALSGPTHAEEVGRGLPTAAVIASGDIAVATAFQEVLHGPRFRVYTSTDVVGVELCGALKNVVALATGAADGLGLGDNTRAMLITRSLAEIGRLARGGRRRCADGGRPGRPGRRRRHVHQSTQPQSLGRRADRPRTRSSGGRGQYAQSHRGHPRHARRGRARRSVWRRPAGLHAG